MVVVEVILIVDLMYKIVCEMLDKMYLLFKNYDVQKNGLLKDKLLWQCWDVVLKVMVFGGVQSSVFNVIVNCFGWFIGKVQLGFFMGFILVGNSVG